MIRAAARDEQHAELLLRLGLRSYLCVPLTAQGRTLGAVTFIAAESGRRYGPADLALAEDLARRAAIALVNARLFEELREADQRKTTFLAVLAHELRNPLAPVRSALEILRMPEAGAEDALAARAVMERQVTHLVRLVDDLLDVSRIMRGKVQIRRGPLELSAVVARAVETARPVIDAQGQELIVALPPGPLCLEGDEIRLAQVVGNLLMNAAKYSERGGRIWLSAALESGGREPAEVTLRVRDEGVGIPPEHLERIFDLFAQVDGTVGRAQGGLGIGLTLVRSLVELHGGRVEAHSAGPGRGSEFVVRLPLRPSADSPEPLADGRHSIADSRSRRVLVVDDNVDAAQSLAAVLRLSGHEVRVANDGRTALEVAPAFGPEVILLDIGMPELDGYEVARRLRQQPRFAGTRIVALTGWGTAEDRARSRAAGFDEHLTKPVAPRVLQELLAAAVPRD
jgi:signal transduction histidine kinase